MPSQSRAILGVNIILCAGIIATWTLGAVWRRRSMVESGPAVSPPVMSPAPALQPPALAAPVADGETQALRGEIREVRAEANAELAQIQERAQEYRERGKNLASLRRLKLSYDEFLAACPEDMPPEIYESIKQNLLSHLQEDTKKRIRARQIILDALAESSATDAEYRQVQEWFAQLDEFDSKVTLHDYAAEEFPPELHINMESCRILYRALGDRAAGMSWDRLLRLMNPNNLGFFVFLPEDREKISAAFMGGKINEGSDDE